MLEKISLILIRYNVPNDPEFKIPVLKILKSRFLGSENPSRVIFCVFFAEDFQAS